MGLLTLSVKCCTFQTSNICDIVTNELTNIQHVSLWLCEIKTANNFMTVKF